MSGKGNWSGEMSHVSSEKEADVLLSNINAAKGVADIVRTSLGPCGLDKLVVSAEGDVLITNDGATIMDKIAARHPAARMLVELSRSQDIEAGDGTTTVVVLAGAILNSCLRLFKLGIHPMTISSAFQLAEDEAQRILLDVMAKPVDIQDRDLLIKLATTSLASKVISAHSDKLAPVAVDAVMKIVDPAMPENVDLNNIKIHRRLGGTVRDSEIVDGVVFTRGLYHASNAPKFVEST
ncbi:chaperone tailless complex polypeptide 1 [Kipferlia bialata]|uniref:Chaperone tailless complex polypeptide 1 n=1 Tax=Kipferlia bialata TaxID=797122 RepID=A0A9K3DAM6_9EUKA|nr:chaperone tailless complex polypeptide 1 [Kipferlia bialata]|eukprot:g14722.t1